MNTSSCKRSSRPLHPGTQLCRVASALTPDGRNGCSGHTTLKPGISWSAGARGLSRGPLHRGLLEVGLTQLVVENLRDGPGYLRGEVHAERSRDQESLPSTPSSIVGTKRRISAEEARQVGASLGIDWKSIELEQFRRGLEVELEHGARAGRPMSPMMTSASPGRLPGHTSRSSRIITPGWTSSKPKQAPIGPRGAESPNPRMHSSGQ